MEDDKIAVSKGSFDRIVSIYADYPKPYKSESGGFYEEDEIVFVSEEELNFLRNTSKI